MKKEFMDYVLQTPHNSNPHVMSTMLEGIGEEEYKNKMYDFIKKQNDNINPQVLEVWVNEVFKNFGAGATYTIRIDQSNSDPLACCVYLDDAMGMEKGADEWDTKEIFKDIKPCIMKEGEIVTYLDLNDFTKTVSGESLDITATDIDLMIEFGRFAYRIYDEDDYVYVSISNDATAIAADTRFTYLPFTRGENSSIEKIYIGALGGGIDENGKLRSNPNFIPQGNKTIGEFRTAAQANGEGYEQYTFYQHTMLQCLYLIKYGNLNSQVALGQGYTNSSALKVVVGETYNKGMYYGDPNDGSVSVKFAGIEDFYGNLATFTDGIYCTDNFHATAATDNFNDTAEGYIDLGAVAVEETVGILKTIWGDSALGFIPKTVVGESDMTENSLNENWSDYAVLYAGGFAYCGAVFDYGAYGGAFYLFLVAPASAAASKFGARLSFYK